MRRMFYKWLAAARKVRNRRAILQERECEMQRIQLETAWDRWRGRFQAEKLLPLVSDMLYRKRWTRIRLIANTGEDIHSAKPARDHVSRIRDLALQNRGNFSPRLCARASR
jgi:protein SFI1